jgi:SAM-dependent methyltransferase
VETFEFNIDWSLNTLLRLLDSYQFQTVLDLGSGEGEHTRLLRHWGKEVFSVDLHEKADYEGDFLDVKFDRQFDVVWCSHVLEHQRNVGVFLEKVYRCIVDGGHLAITMPTHPRQRLVSGHLTSWNAGLLCYNLILAGFDCSSARLLQSYELGMIVPKSPAQGSDIGATAAYADLEEVSRFFPFPVSQGGEAEVQECNWGPLSYTLGTPTRPGTVQIKGRFLPEPGLVLRTE